MPTPFEFPLSYIESMTPWDTPAGETGAETVPPPTEGGAPGSAAALRELLSNLKYPTVPQPPQPKQWQRVLGALGDALGAAAAVRAGGMPPAMGPFAANLRQRQMTYEQQQREAEQERYAEERTVRIGAFEEEARLRREKEIAGMRMAAGKRLVKSEFPRDVGGQPHIIQRWQDPQTGEIVAVPDPESGELVYERDLGVRGYAPFIQPAIPGEAPPTRISRTGPLGPIGEIPPPPPGVGETAAKLGGFARDLDAFKRALPGFIEKRGGGTRIGQQVARRVPMVGAQISERISKEGEVIAATRDTVMADFVRIMSGLQASEMEQARLARILPDLGTVDVETALAKINQFEQSVRAFARELVHQRPHLLTPELTELLGLDGESDPLLDELWGGGR